MAAGRVLAVAAALIGGDGCVAAAAAGAAGAIYATSRGVESLVAGRSIGWRPDASR